MTRTQAEAVEVNAAAAAHLVRVTREYYAANVRIAQAAREVAELRRAPTAITP